MGSDLYMNPPRPINDFYDVATDEAAMEYVVGALATRKEVKLVPHGHDDGWRVYVFTGRWS